MSVISNNILAGAAGAAGAALYVDDVFSTYLYEGNNTLRSIQNGIDLSGEGGLVWIKNRDSGTQDHVWCDTERGAGKILESNNTGAEFTSTARVDSFLSDGFKVGTDNATNQGTVGLTSICSWTFRKAPGFFDVVTYTGDGTNPRSIAHSLGSKPGFFIVKRLDAAGSWWCYHHSRTNSKVLELNTTAAEDTFSYWPSEPTSTHFTVSASASINGSGNTYVCYLFAHDDQSFGKDEDEAIIKCGSATADSNGVLNVTGLGFEPQWVLVKNIADGNQNWLMYDVMRGFNRDNAERIRPNLSDAESQQGYSDHDNMGPTADGFGTDFGSFGANEEHIYVAIRRPHKPPEAATDVFAGSTASSGSTISTGFNVDWAISKGRNGTSGYVGTRLLSNDKYLLANSSSAENSFSNGWTFDLSDSFVQSQIGTNPITFAFRRAPGFFDAVAYTGTGSARTQKHNLAAVPELIIVKARDASSGWYAYAAPLGNSSSLLFNSDEGANTSSGAWNNTSPTSSVFSLPGFGWNNNHSGVNYIAYLFATLPGISKVGSYTGTGTDGINVDCGFTGGARFVLIKRTDGPAVSGNGDWYVWDSTRGIVSGNDPYLLINTTGAEVTTTDYIDPLNAGFTVTSSAPAALNASGGTYIFLAIA